jgi:hypothetical protein
MDKSGLIVQPTGGSEPSTMQTEPNWMREAGIAYRRDTAQHPLNRGETLLYYTWRYHPTGEEGTAFVVLDTPFPTAARRRLLELLAHWNSGQPALWSYREGSGAEVHTRH